MKTLNKRFLALALAAALGGVVQAAPFQNGSFETGPTPGGYVTLSAGDTQITGWTVTGDSVDYIGSYWPAADGSRSLDLSGDAGGGVAQAFDTVAGRTYRVGFALAGNPDCAPTVKTVQVQATGAPSVYYLFDTTNSSLSNMGWAAQTYTFTATGPTTTLAFASQDNTGCGPALDNVAVNDITPAPVPALSAWGLLGLAGLLGFAAMRGRRRIG
mgnify:FL=1